MKSLKIPATKKYLTNLYESIIDQFRSGYDVKLCGIAETGKSATLKFLAFNSEAQEFRDLYKKFSFFYIDDSRLDDEAYFWISMAEQLRLEYNKEDVPTLFAKVAHKIQTKSNVSDDFLVFVLNDFYKWVISKEFVERLLMLRHYNEDRIKFLLIQDVGTISNEINIGFEEKIKLKEIYVPLFDIENVKYSISRTLHKNGRRIKNKFDSKTIDEILDFSGGIVGLVKQLSLIRYESNDFEISKLLTEQAIKARLEKIWQSINAVWRKDVMKGKPIKDLVLSGLQNADGTMKSTLLKIFISNYVEKDETDYLEILTPQESLIYSLFLNNVEKIVTRDQVAKKLWGEEYLEKYSDWGIDSVISRIRRKIHCLNLQTLKGRGFILKKHP